MGEGWRQRQRSQAHQPTQPPSRTLRPAPPEPSVICSSDSVEENMHCTRSPVRGSRSRTYIEYEYMIIIFL
eukprot:scaffold33272_cov84-Isochrysis_galbana.AAC.2